MKKWLIVVVLLAQSVRLSAITILDALGDNGQEYIRILGGVKVELFQKRHFDLIKRLLNEDFDTADQKKLRDIAGKISNFATIFSKLKDLKDMSREVSNTLLSLAQEKLTLAQKKLTPTAIPVPVAATLADQQTSLVEEVAPPVVFPPSAAVAGSDHELMESDDELSESELSESDKELMTNIKEIEELGEYLEAADYTISDDQAFSMQKEFFGNEDYFLSLDRQGLKHALEAIFKQKIGDAIDFYPGVFSFFLSVCSYVQSKKRDIKKLRDIEELKDLNSVIVRGGEVEPFFAKLSDDLDEVFKHDDCFFLSDPENFYKEAYTYVDVLFGEYDLDKEEYSQAFYFYLDVFLDKWIDWVRFNEDFRDKFDSKFKDFLKAIESVLSALNKFDHSDYMPAKAGFADAKTNLLVTADLYRTAQKSLTDAQLNLNLDHIYGCDLDELKANLDERVAKFLAANKAYTKAEVHLLSLEKTVESFANKAAGIFKENEDIFFSLINFWNLSGEDSDLIEKINGKVNHLLEQYPGLEDVNENGYLSLILEDYFVDLQNKRTKFFKRLYELNELIIQGNLEEIPFLKEDEDYFDNYFKEKIEKSLLDGNPLTRVEIESCLFGKFKEYGVYRNGKYSPYFFRRVFAFYVDMIELFQIYLKQLASI